MLSLVILAVAAKAVAWTDAFYPEQEPGYGSTAPGSQLLSDMSIISRSWGQVSTYGDNDDRYFGVQDIGLPDGCGIQQVHILHRHGQRFPTSSYDDGGNDETFAKKVTNWTAANSTKLFTGPLALLSTYKSLMGESYLTGLGAAAEFESGAVHWNRYGRVLYNATVSQLAYNASSPDGSAHPKPVLRTTTQSRMWNSQINWALGFFGSSFTVNPNPTLANATAPFNVVIIPVLQGPALADPVPAGPKAVLRPFAPDPVRRALRHRSHRLLLIKPYPLPQPP
jgi:hypothetical protein